MPLRLPQPDLQGRRAITLGVAVLGGFLATLIQIPLAWMIGAMVAVSALGLTGFRVETIAVVRPLALVVLGTGLGQTFTPPVLAALVTSLPALVVAGLGSILAGIAASRLLARMAGIDSKTAYYGSVPGGIILMIVLAARAGVSVPLVTLSQTLRMMPVVLTFPPLLVALVPPGIDLFSLQPVPVSWPLLPVLFALTGAGALGLLALKLANPWMMGPVGVSLILALMDTPLSGVPGVLIDTAQVLMGWNLGTRINRDVILRSRRLAIASVASTAVTSALCILVALGVSAGFDLPVAATILGTAPGGMPEMAITAKVLNLGVPLVLGFHLVRIMLCNILVEPLYRAYAWAERRLGLQGP